MIGPWLWQGKATQPIAGDRDAAPLQVESTSMTEVVKLLLTKLELAD